MTRNPIIPTRKKRRHHSEDLELFAQEQPRVDPTLGWFAKVHLAEEPPKLDNKEGEAAKVKVALLPEVDPKLALNQETEAKLIERPNRVRYHNNARAEVVAPKEDGDPAVSVIPVVWHGIYKEWPQAPQVESVLHPN